MDHFGNIGLTAYVWLSESMLQIYNIDWHNTTEVLLSNEHVSEVTSYIGDCLFIMWETLDTHTSVIYFNVAVAIVVGVCATLAATHAKKSRSENIADENMSTLSVLDMAKTAYEAGHTDAVIDLVKKRNFDINFPLQHNGLTLFLCSCISGQQRLINFMLKKGADLMLCTRGGDSPLYLATHGVITMAIAYSKPADTKVLQDLISAGTWCDVNQRNIKGYTALHRAASKGDLAVIRCLLDNGADPTLTTETGIIPIDLATNAGHLEAAELLAIGLDDLHVWDIVEPCTPPRVHAKNTS